MSLDPGEDMYPANRANVYLKLNKWAEAEKDCTDAVKLDPKASKVIRKQEGQKEIHQYFFNQAFDRRGQARMQLQKYKEALEDFEEAKKLEPKTPNVDTNIGKATEKLKEQEKEQEKEKEKASEKEEKAEDKTEENGEKAETTAEETKVKESFTKSDAELLQDIEVRIRIICMTDSLQ